VCICVCVSIYPYLSIYLSIYTYIYIEVDVQRVGPMRTRLYIYMCGCMTTAMLNYASRVHGDILWSSRATPCSSRIFCCISATVLRCVNPCVVRINNIDIKSRHQNGQNTLEAKTCWALNARVRFQTNLISIRSRNLIQFRWGIKEGKLPRESV
jgi:hypothetical protein